MSGFRVSLMLMVFIGIAARLIDERNFALEREQAERRAHSEDCWRWQSAYCRKEIESDSYLSLMRKYRTETKRMWAHIKLLEQERDGQCQLQLIQQPCGLFTIATERHPSSSSACSPEVASASANTSLCQPLDP